MFEKLLVLGLCVLALCAVLGFLLLLSPSTGVVIVVTIALCLVVALITGISNKPKGPLD